MLTALLAAGATEAASGGNQFGIALNYIAMQIVSFAILAFVLYRWGLKPVLATMDERKAKIESGLQYAEEMKARLAQAKQESEELLRRASVEAQAIINEARQTARQLADRQAQETAAQAAAILAKAEQTIASERRQMLAEVRGEIARLVTLTAGKVLSRELSAEERARYNEAASRELTGV